MSAEEQLTDLARQVCLAVLEYLTRLEHDSFAPGTDPHPLEVKNGGCEKCGWAAGLDTQIDLLGTYRTMLDSDKAEVAGAAESQYVLRMRSFVIGLMQSNPPSEGAVEALFSDFPGLVLQNLFGEKRDLRRLLTRNSPMGRLMPNSLKVYLLSLGEEPG